MNFLKMLLIFTVKIRKDNIFLIKQYYYNMTYRFITEYQIINHDYYVLYKINNYSQISCVSTSSIILFSSRGSSNLTTSLSLSLTSMLLLLLTTSLVLSVQIVISFGRSMNCMCSGNTLQSDVPSSKRTVYVLRSSPS